MRRLIVAMLLLLPASLFAADFEVALPRDGLDNTFSRLEAGEPLHLVYLGGSVTQGPGYREHVTQWFQREYPDQVTSTNAGWPGTGSAIGVLRLPFDVLPHDPDLVFIEFAINDETWDPLDFIMRNYEGMVRQIWQHNPETDICFIETFATYIQPRYDAGELPTSVEAHYRVADHYGIPSVNVGWALYARVLAGQSLKELLPDGAHPTAAGHRIYADAVIGMLEAEKISDSTPAPHVIPHPLTDHPVMGTERILLESRSLPPGWVRDSGFGVDSFIRSNLKGSELTIDFNGPVAVLKFIMNEDAGTIGYAVDDGDLAPIDLKIDYTIVHAYPVAKTASPGPHTLRLRVLSDEGEVRLVHVDHAKAE